MNRQIFYQDDELKKYYLSPYTDVCTISESKVLLIRYDTGRKVTLEVSSESTLSVILKTLQNGLKVEQVIEIFGDMKLFDIFLQNGVIE